MKRADLQITRILSVATSLTLFTGVFFTPPANAANLGSAPCVQTIDTTAGVSVYQDGNSCFVALKNATTYVWTPPTGISKVDILIVAGGGGGGTRHAGGGGAGGLINSTNTLINSSGLTVVVGGGGAGGAATSTNGNEGSNGSNSQVSGGGITTRTAIGGGGGAYNLTAGSGGSGGGAGCCGQSLGSATAGQGNLGSVGATNNSSYWVGGGGGGAGAVGGTSSASTGGSGGSGVVVNWISPAAQSALGVGQNISSQIYFAGGGGGGTDRVAIPGGIGGNGGGGTGTNNATAGANGAANTGGGGGAGGINGGGAPKGGDGGSGVVVIRYSIPLFTNSATSSIAENASTITNAATITVSDSSTITIQGGVDAAFFTIITSDSVTARIRFIVSPDFEALSDSGANNEYEITIRAVNTMGNFQDSALKISVTDVLEPATINLPSLSGTAYKGRLVTVTVTVGAPGKVRFLVAGKKLPNCLSQSTSGAYPNYTATCAWKPSISGTQALTAILTPTNGAISPVTSAATRVLINRRTTTR